MTQKFLQAVYARRPAPKDYDASWINIEFARINKAIASIPRDTVGAPAISQTQTTTTDRIEATTAAFGPPLAPGLNLVEYSQQFDVGSWSKLNSATVVGNSIMAPDGTLTGATLIAAVASGAVQSGPFTTLTSTKVTMSVHIKRLTTTSQTNFGIWDLTANAGVAESGALWTGNAITGISNTGGGSTNYVWTDAGNGWWRCSGLTNASLDPTHLYAFYVYARNYGNTGSIYVWGAQVNAGNLITYIETRGIATTLAVVGNTALGPTSASTFAVTSLPSSAFLGTNASGVLVAGTAPAINPKASGLVFPYSANYISGTGTAEIDNYAGTVKQIAVQGNTLTQVGDRLRLRVIWTGSTGGAITGTLTFHGVTVATVTDAGTTAVQSNEAWIDYIDASHANVVEGEAGAPGAASGVNVGGFDWSTTQYAALSQNAIIDNHIVVYAITLDIYPKGV